MAEWRKPPSQDRRPQPALTWHSMGKRGALGKGHQASEGRLDPDTNYIFQLRSHLVGERVSRCLDNFVFGRVPMGLNEDASSVNGEIVTMHATTHDLNLVPVLDPVHVLDQIARIDNRGL